MNEAPIAQAQAVEPQARQAGQTAPPAPPVEPHTQSGLVESEAAKMATWAREDLAAGKITQAQADQIFGELNTPVDQRVTPPETRSQEEQLRDAHFPVARPDDFSIRYGVPGQELPMTTELKQFDTTARTWLSEAGFERNLGNALVNEIDRVTQRTHKMSAQELEGYGWAEYGKLEQVHGDKLEEKLKSAGRMIEELDKKQPGLKNLLRSKGIGDNALIANLLIQQSQHYHARRQRRGDAIVRSYRMVAVLTRASA